MKMQNVNDLMMTGLSYLLDFEEKIGQEASKMAEATSDPEVKEMFQKTVSKSQEYASKVQQSFEKLGTQVQKNDNKIAKAMIDEVENMISNTEASPVRDAALIVAANQMQLYRVAAYGSLETYAQLLGKQDAARGLRENLDDSKAGDAKLTKIAEERVNHEAAGAMATA